MEMKKGIDLIKFLLLVFVLGYLGHLVYVQWFGAKQKEDLSLEETPLIVQQVRSIHQLATLKYTDEVVMDTLERYKNGEEQLTGNLLKARNPKNLQYMLIDSYTKRRLTLIVKGEARIGFDLDDPTFKIFQNQDSIWMHFPTPKILDLNVNPNDIEVFLENGSWSDQARKELLTKAKTKMTKSVNRLKLYSKAKKSLENVVKNTIQDERVLLVYFH